MNLLEFKGFAKAKEWGRFVFLSGNQEDDEPYLNNVEICFIFSKMHVMTGEPFGIYFSGGSGAMNLLRVVDVEYIRQESKDVFVIFCDDGNYYVFVAWGASDRFDEFEM